MSHLPEATIRPTKPCGPDTTPKGKAAGGSAVPPARDCDLDNCGSCKLGGVRAHVRGRGESDMEWFRVGKSDEEPPRKSRSYPLGLIPPGAPLTPTAAADPSVSPCL